MNAELAVERQREGRHGESSYQESVFHGVLTEISLGQVLCCKLETVKQPVSYIPEQP